MTAILGIDPGPTRSAWLLLAGGCPWAFGIVANDELAAILRGDRGYRPAPDVLVIEEITSYGAKVLDRRVFTTVAWAGRFAEALHDVPCAWLPRSTVASRLGARGDAGVRAALIDRWGGQDAAIGRKAAPGPLYGISGDVWSALACAVAYEEGAR